MTTDSSSIYWKNLICWLLAAFWFPCIVSCNELMPLDTFTEKRIPHQQIEAGVQSLLPEMGTHFEAYIDKDSFSKAYAQIHFGVLPKPEAPKVDFKHHLVIGAFLGRRPTAGYGIDLGPLKSIRDKDGEILEAIVRIVEPPAGVMAAQVMTSPYVLVQVPRSEWHRILFRDTDGHIIAELPGV